MDIPAFFGFDVLGEAFGAFGLAVDDEEFSRGALQGREPFGEFVFVGVGGEAGYLYDLSFDGIGFAEDSGLFEAAYDEPAEGANGLVADKE